MKTARETILEKLRASVHPEPESPDFDAPVYFPVKEPLEEAFKKNLEQVNGSVTICGDCSQFYKELQLLLKEKSSSEIICDDLSLAKELAANHIPTKKSSETDRDPLVGITRCEFLIAHTGSIMVSSRMAGGRRGFIFPETHIVVARKEQVVDYLKTAYQKITDKYKRELPSQITLITGPSRTADIEKTLVMGAHGPRYLKVFIY